MSERRRKTQENDKEGTTKPESMHLIETIGYIENTWRSYLHNIEYQKTRRRPKISCKV